MAVTRILAIGNSFSEDAAYYVHPMAEAAGAQVKIVNLYIGGCSLETHWRNIESGEAAYQYQLNGVNTERYVSVEEALGEEAWDYVVTQQASHDSGWLDTYTPFIGRMQAYIRQKAPSAELLLHETWAYETDSSHGAFMRYNRSQTEMFERLRHAYRKTAQDCGLRMIPSGEVIQRLRGTDPFRYAQGGMSLCRDGFHMSYLYGRYLLACVWTAYLLHLPLADNAFVPSTALAPEEKADPAVLQVIREGVTAALA
ncbi:MAG: DUF4886 domain-containing protein [Acutalibacteraceae bacterium]